MLIMKSSNMANRKNYEQKNPLYLIPTQETEFLQKPKQLLHSFPHNTTDQHSLISKT